MNRTTWRRSAIQDLIKWKDSEERRSMVLKDARQVEKTWKMKEFGQSCYKNFVYFNFDEEDDLKSIFETNKNPHHIIALLSILRRKQKNKCMGGWRLIASRIECTIFSAIEYMNLSFYSPFLKCK